MHELGQFKTSTPVIRRATSDDASMLAALAARLFAQAFRPTNDPDDIRMHLTETFSPEKQLAEIVDPARAVWIAEDDDGRAVGYAMVRVGVSGPGVVGDRPAEVQRIYADAEWHGRGVGAALMRACIDHAVALGCDVVWLGVWERNPRAIAFYEKMGYVAVAKQTFLLGRDLQHDLVMSRAL
jgi:ribosomal protein S18 acetylase RimI-like enzyme